MIRFTFVSIDTIRGISKHLDPVVIWKPGRLESEEES